MNAFWGKSSADPRLPIIGQAVASGARSESASSRPSVREWVHDEGMLRSLGPEFAEYADLPPDEPTRRHFLQIMGASMALATASGCVNQPQETIVPYVRPPEQLVPGKPLYYATAMTLAGGSLGLLVETHMGRPTKVEGNPLHPAVPEAMPAASRVAPADVLRFGATDAFAQAVMLSLYDPDRSQTILRNGQIDTWETLYSELRTALERLAPGGGQGLRLLTEPVLSPTLAGQIQQLLTQFPNARWHQYEPIHDDNVLAGARLAFGDDVGINYLNAPQVVLSLDADCFGDGPSRLQLARKIRGQVPKASGAALPRLYVVESSSTITGTVADHRLPVSPRGVVAFALAVAREVGLGVSGGEDYVGAEKKIPQNWVDTVVQDLTSSRGRSVVIAGRGQPPVVHAVAHWLNFSLGNVGQTVEYRAPILVRSESVVASIGELARAIHAKEVEALVILGGNPAYNAPVDTKFADALATVPFALHLSQYVDETSARCKWHISEAHLFESWSDTRAVDGTASIVQPLIAPLYEGKTAHELLAALSGSPASSSHDLVRGYWQQRLSATDGSRDFERLWKTALHDGVMAGTQSDVRTPALTADFNDVIAAQVAPVFAATVSKLPQISFRPDSSVWDGRFANSGWLQELPRPLTKLTWDNAVLISPRTADEHRIRTGDVIAVSAGDQSVELPAFVVPGHPDQTLTLHLGYGRQRAGRVGNGVGADVYPLRRGSASWFADVTEIRNTGRTAELATTQHHHHMAGRELVRAGTLAEFREAPDHPAFMAAHGHAEPHSSMYPERAYDGYKWGMVVNQSACIGCNACVVACQSENNIPVVGKDQVWRGREMHWLRIDSYYHDREDEPANPTVYHQPVMCVHCELAPCEPVCPVAATTHSDEGLNEMTYNRCIGTRYCSNNCPYKVRRFNFFDYNGELREDKTMQLRPNPDVTIRSRGVMEKCTYCVQRINAARIAADIEGRQIRDGEILTACQAACPTQALTFGNLNDEQSEVRQLSESSLNYALLGELNTRPRTTYLAVVRNPHGAME
ncbi:MAG: 4Fe-4S dicluster domain-containing protein [Planctomycetes bacterium]|nr:4Fe-4S dicluster domain-containing protein [Planctomycetota bacterium]